MAPEPVVELDCRGLRCPQPVIMLARRLPSVAIGSLVAVVSTDAASRVDVPAWCRMRGQEYAGSDLAADGTPRHLVRRVS